MLTNNQITENLVYIRDNNNLSRTDRDQLADAANRIQDQDKVLGMLNQLQGALDAMSRDDRTRVVTGVNVAVGNEEAKQLLNILLAADTVIRTMDKQ